MRLSRWSSRRPAAASASSRCRAAGQPGRAVTAGSAPSSGQGQVREDSCRLYHLLIACLSTCCRTWHPHSSAPFYCPSCIFSAACADGSFQMYRSESFTMIGVPPGRCSMDMYAPPPASTHLSPLAGLGILVAATLAGGLGRALLPGWGISMWKQDQLWVLCRGLRVLCRASA